MPIDHAGGDLRLGAVVDRDGPRPGGGHRRRIGAYDCAGRRGMLVRAGAILGFDPQGRRYAQALGGLEIASSLAILVLGLLFLAGSLWPPA